MKASLHVRSQLYGVLGSAIVRKAAAVLGRCVIDMPATAVDRHHLLRQHSCQCDSPCMDQPQACDQLLLLLLVFCCFSNSRVACGALLVLLQAHQQRSSPLPHNTHLTEVRQDAA
jgi:hypothetical protein